MNRHYDYIVIGGGSGGISSIKYASIYGKKCALIEGKKLGGTCVNLGCVPKKIMWYASNISEIINFYAANYGFDILKSNFDLKKLIKIRNNYINRVSQSYYEILKKNNITIIKGFGSFIDKNTLKVNNEFYSADHILISSGSYPFVPEIRGSEYGITSDGFFELKKLPKRVAIIGAGYIAIEIAGILNSLGVETHLFIRKNIPLRSFDSIIKKTLIEIMNIKGIILHNNSILKEIIKNDNNSLTLKLENNNEYIVDVLIWAVGRKPMTNNLNIEVTGVKLDEYGYIKVDKYQNTNIKNIYAVGDNTNTVKLAPVAVTAGRNLSKRLFNNSCNMYLDYNTVPTVVFFNPPICAVGLTEFQAIKKYGFNNVKIYTSTFNSMYTSITLQNIPCRLKLVCINDNEKIIGIHGIGFGMDEILQGFVVALRIGATKKDFDNTIAIHPTIAEEFVTIR
ncbi:glutathione-disulfide reductase [Candidatus Providencia siddallii]|uniref:Glutathione reductase n=1 Tax=Candidatus Providencia siddallii TaxID=1715285 RepID=A0ABM9NPG8_9GAMM